ncbi:MAG TPA: hypothetical protein HPP77_09190 [Candidatus Hydrogenedentes bacterium]|nr:hypothetical protein [Candidatus Hydrogenedentota bacterium]HIJ73798.1 hypothetical protein [Candidatus Hydrogenedentota bacterium]
MPAGQMADLSGQDVTELLKKVAVPGIESPPGMAPFSFGNENSPRSIDQGTATVDDGSSETLGVATDNAARRSLLADEMLQRLENLAEVTPDDARVYREMAHIYLEQKNDPIKAREMCAKSLELDPEQPDLRLLMLQQLDQPHAPQSDVPGLEGLPENVRPNLPQLPQIPLPQAPQMP